MGSATAAALREVGLTVDPDEVDQRVAAAIRELAGRQLPGDPRGEFTPAEEAILAEGSFDRSPRRVDEPEVGLRAAAQYAALLATALTVPQAAQRLGLDGSRIRQRLLKRELYGIRQRRGWLIPLVQFDAPGLVPGLERVLPRLDPHLHPLSVVGWLTRPHPDLYPPGDPEETPISPREWLRSGGDPAVVAELASDVGTIV